METERGRQSTVPCWVFAYGSNMHTGDLEKYLARHGVHGGVLGVLRATLDGYKLVWNYYSKTRNGGAANIEFALGSVLEGVALFVTPEAFAVIDRKEGHPDFYTRGEALLQISLTDGRTVRAWVYRAVRTRCSETPVWPRREYLQLLIDAACQHKLSTSYIAALQRTPTRD